MPPPRQHGFPACDRVLLRRSVGAGCGCTPHGQGAGRSRREAGDTGSGAAVHHLDEHRACLNRRSSGPTPRLACHLRLRGALWCPRSRGRLGASRRKPRCQRAAHFPTLVPPARPARTLTGWKHPRAHRSRHARGRRPSPATVSARGTGVGSEAADSRLQSAACAFELRLCGRPALARLP